MAPGTVTATNGLTAPELQIASSPALIEYINNMRGYAARSETAENFAPQYDYLMSLAQNPASLTDHMNLIFTAGRFEQSTWQGIRDTIAEIGVSGNNDTEGLRNRVIAAVGLTVTSIEFMTQQ